MSVTRFVRFRTISLSSMTSLPVLHFSTAHHSEEVGFEAWRRLMAPIYGIVPNSRSGRHPGGSTAAYLIGDLLANRTIFSPQAITRDRRRVDATPDHIIFQFWRTGGYIGEIQTQPIAYGPSTVVLSDRRRTLAGRFGPSDTIGLVVPRPVLADLDLETRPVRFDPVRNRLLQARLVALHRELPGIPVDRVPELRDELVGLLRRILDPSTAPDVLEGAELNRSLSVLADRFILAHLGSRELSPTAIASGLGISRATLYRVFAAQGGVMQAVQEQRFRTIRDALADPLETRTLTDLAAAHGLHSPAYLSRNFRARFGVTPTDWRQACRAVARERAELAPERLHGWFNDLGKRFGPPV